MDFQNNIFINCPIDDFYINDFLKPILFAIVNIKFTPRLSLEFSDSGEIRLEKITKIIKECKYSIHDLSIVKSKNVEEYARMNMPFELGIDYGLRKSGNQTYESKQFLILEANKYDYMKAISDINGFDIKVHHNQTQKIFDCLYSWFSETLKIVKQDPPRKTYSDFINFNTTLFKEKFNQFGSEKFAKDYIEHISIPEYISEIKEKLSEN